MQIVTVRRVGMRRGFPYYGVGIYTAVPRKRDGVLTYRLTETIECAHPRSVARCHDRAREVAAERTLQCSWAVRHGSVVGGGF